MFGKRNASSTSPAEAEPIVKELILPREAAESSDPYQLISANITFCNYLLDEGQFQPAEMIQEPIWSYQVDYYQAQVNNGGHEQYVGNSRIATGKMGPTIEATQRGLAAMGADDYAAIYAALLQLVHSGRSRVARFAEALGMSDLGTRFEELDERFFGLAGGDRLIRQNCDFLLNLKSLRLVPQASWEAELAGLARLNPQLQLRASAAEREREEREAKDPHTIVAKELCRRAGRTFDGWTAVNPGCKLDGQDVHGWFMRTDQGPAIAAFVADEALLFRYEPDAGMFFTRNANVLSALKLGA